MEKKIIQLMQAIINLANFWGESNKQQMYGSFEEFLLKTSAFFGFDGLYHICMTPVTLSTFFFTRTWFENQYLKDLKMISEVSFEQWKRGP